MFSSCQSWRDDGKLPVHICRNGGNHDTIVEQLHLCARLCATSHNGRTVRLDTHNIKGGGNRLRRFRAGRLWLVLLGRNGGWRCSTKQKRCLLHGAPRQKGDRSHSQNRAHAEQ
jgi:hypothetical protein